MDFSRIDRLQSQMIKELGAITDEELKDRPPHMLTFTRTEISKDLRYAKVYFSVLGSQEEVSACSQYLERHAGVIRKIVGSRMRMRHMPEIKYIYDDSLNNVARIGEILSQIKDESNEK